MEKHQRQNEKVKWFIYSTFLVWSIIFVFLHSYSTSPLYPMYGYDSAIFQVIGKYWAEGTIPYSGLFDHKGPIIFFINMLGYLIFQSKQGVAVIQVLFLFGYMILANRLFQMKFSQRKSWIFTLLSTIVLAVNYFEGNLTEEYALPFLMAFYLGVYQWLEQEETNNEAETYPGNGQVFFYGIAFGFCLFTRVTNGLGIFVSIVAISIYFISRNKWKKLLGFSWYFVLGILAITLPFVIYFAVHGNLYDMIWGTLLYNFQYAENVDGGFFSESLIKSLRAIYRFGVCFLLLGAGIIRLVENYKLRGWMYIANTVAMLCLFFGSRQYRHYYMITVPYMCLCLMEVDFYMREQAARLGIKRVAIFVVYGYLLSTILYASIFERGSAKEFLLEDKPLSILGLIPETEKDDVVIYNGTTQWYLQCDIKPCYSYFALQDWQGGQSAELEKQIYTAYATCEAKWIVASKQTAIVQDILDEQYEVICEEAGFVLYKNKNQ